MLFWIIELFVSFEIFHSL